MEPVSRYDYCHVLHQDDGRQRNLDVLAELYLPLIKANGFGVYHFLNQQSGTIPHSIVFSRLCLSPGEFENALKALEATGLVKTYVESYEGVNMFTYLIIPPRTENEFLENILLSGTLKSIIGSDAYNALLRKQDMQGPEVSGKEVTARFPDVFKQEDAPASYFIAQKGAKKPEDTISTGFDRALYLRKMADYGVREGAIGQKQLQDVDYLATLYSLDEEKMAELSFESREKVPGKKGHFIDMAALQSKCRSLSPFLYYRQEGGVKSEIKSDSARAQQIEMMETLTPAKYLTLLQKGHKPASADLKIAERLGLEVGLSDACINALLNYILIQKEEPLSWSYCEKVGASLVRGGCVTAKDAMDFLYRRRKKTKPAPARDKMPRDSVQAKPNEDDDDDMSEEEMQRILSSIKKGGKP